MTVAGALGLALLGEAVESFLGVLAAGRFGASRWGMIGTFVGGAAGAAAGTRWLPVAGPLPGAFAGAFAGAFLGERGAGHPPGVSPRAGFRGFLGRIGATVLKLGIGLTPAFITLRAGFFLFMEKT